MSLNPDRVRFSVSLFRSVTEKMADDPRVDILLVDDNPGDVRLISEALEETEFRPGIRHAKDGFEAMQFLRRQPPFENAPKPAIILLDLNLPRKDGRAVLAEIKSDSSLASIPVIVFSGSDAPQDISACYALHANSYIVKPRDLTGLTETVECLTRFWLGCVTLPPDSGPRTWSSS